MNYIHVSYLTCYTATKFRSEHYLASFILMLRRAANKRSASHMPLASSNLPTIDIYLSELPKFIYQLYHRKLPQKFYASFCKLSEIHNHNTRNTTFLTYFISRISLIKI